MKRYLPIALGLLLFVLVIRLWKISLADTLVMLQHSDWRLLILSLVTFIVMTYFKGIRWSFLLRMQGATYSIWNCFLIYMATLYLGNVTPGRAGDFAKVFYLNKDLNYSTGKSMASVLVDRVFDLYLLLILGGMGILLNPMPDDPSSAKMVLAVKVFFAILILITLLAFNKKIGGVLLKAAFQKLMKQEHRDKTDKVFDDFHEGMEAFYKPSILYPAFLSLVSYVFFFEGCYLISQAAGLNLNFFYIAFCVSVVNIVSLLTLFGMGTREAALILLFGLVGLKPDQAMTYSLLLLLVGVILFSLLGLGCFLIKPIQLNGRSPVSR
ncbi:MAG TPA: lysylphosphatidylglycerol synthase transmembrane domain-containing protein [bacterium]|nr:lysylphosphatidylglycerol synthase transmembrane domain-containing protein [bacterium]